MAVLDDTARTAEIQAALAGYAERFHVSVGDGHHVASPLGAWLLLSLLAPAATGAVRDELAGILGMDPADAARAAAGLLDHPHPLVSSAAALWLRPGNPVSGLDGWLASLPAAAETGPLPSQADLDKWAREHTLGLIDEFPLQVSPNVLLILASALATQISWKTPFDVASATALGTGSRWAHRLTRVLRTPELGHSAYVAATKRAGDVIVHVADAKPVRMGFYDEAGLYVVSVAAAPDVEPVDVLAAAYQIAPTVHRPTDQRSLYDLPLGDGPLWTIREQPELTHSLDGRGQRCHAVLPCWSARSHHDLRAPELGFPTATRILALLAERSMDFQARQSAVARYSRYGFEAAALTAFGGSISAPSPGWSGSPSCASVTRTPSSPSPSTTAATPPASRCHDPGTASRYFLPGSASPRTYPKPTSTEHAAVRWLFCP
jgi:hypothetical protein